MCSHGKLFVVSLVIFTVAAVVYHFGISAYPVEKGTVEEFWKIATDLGEDSSLSEPDNWGTDFYPPYEGRVYYCIQQYHSASIKYVTLAELLQDLEGVEEKLFDRSINEKKNEESYESWINNAMIYWQSRAQGERRVADLISHLHTSLLANYAIEDNDRFAYKLEDKYYFEERLRNIEFYWLTMLFEFVWLSLVAFLLMWPWLRKASFNTYALHFCLAFPLLFLPYYLGYASLTFTSAYLGEGIIYHYIIMAVEMIFRFDTLTTIKEADNWLLENSPRLFSHFAQFPDPIMGIPYHTEIGPLKVCFTSLILFCLIIAVHGSIRLVLNRFR